MGRKELCEEERKRLAGLIKGINTELFYVLRDGSPKLGFTLPKDIERNSMLVQKLLEKYNTEFTTAVLNPTRNRQSYILCISSKEC